MNTKFTPEPWVKNGIHVFGSNNRKVIVIDGPAFGSESVFKHAEANKNLVMAAPELYEALEAMPEEYGEYAGLSTDLAVCALAKARGES